VTGVQTCALPISKTILLYPKLECEIGCSYCFEKPFSERLLEGKKPIEQKFNYNKEKMVESLTNICSNRDMSKANVILHGGEVLLLDFEDFKFFIENMKKSGIGILSLQTSLFGLTKEHIEVIKENNVNVGISIDGPPELNILRGPRNNPVLNKKYQDTICENLEILRESGINPGVISLINKANAGNKKKLDKLIEWSRTKTGGGRFNPMFLPFWHSKKGVLSQYIMNGKEMKEACLYLLEASLKYSDFCPTFVSEMIDNLLGLNISSCTLSRCDYLSTRCTTIMPDGNIARCDRCFQDGYYYIGNSSYTQQRSEMLAQIEGQCKQNGRICKYFEICGGGCPGEALDKDYRNKSSFCETYYALYERIEGILRKAYPNTPLSVDVPNFFNDYYLKNRLLNPELNKYMGRNKNNPQNNQKIKLPKKGMTQEELRDFCRKNNISHVDQYD
jgi:uncharacterized protein